MGVARDYGKAREFFQKAADAGNPDAMNNLGRLYEEALAWPENTTRLASGTKRPPMPGTRMPRKR